MTEHGWELTKKMFYKRQWGRICLSLTQTRDAQGSAPWYATLEGIGSDPETKKAPFLQLPPSLPDVSAQRLALRWAEPLLASSSETTVLALQDVQAQLAQYGDAEP